VKSPVVPGEENASRCCAGRAPPVVDQAPEKNVPLVSLAVDGDSQIEVVVTEAGRSSSRSVGQASVTRNGRPGSAIVPVTTGLAAGGDYVLLALVTKDARSRVKGVPEVHGAHSWLLDRASWPRPTSGGPVHQEGLGHGQLGGARLWLMKNGERGRSAGDGGSRVARPEEVDRTLAGGRISPRQSHIPCHRRTDAPVRSQPESPS
jgi:hypothetical protein